MTAGQIEAAVAGMIRQYLELSPSPSISFQDYLAAREAAVKELKSVTTGETDGSMQDTSTGRKPVPVQMAAKEIPSAASYGKTPAPAAEHSPVTGLQRTPDRSTNSDATKPGPAAVEKKSDFDILRGLADEWN